MASCRMMARTRMSLLVIIISLSKSFEGTWYLPGRLVVPTTSVVTSAYYLDAQPNGTAINYVKKYPDIDYRELVRI